MFVVPAATRVATPLLPVALLIVATVVPGGETVVDVQVTALVMSCIPPPVNVPVAKKFRDPVARVTVGLVGVTLIEARFASATVTLVVPLIVPEVAVTVALPAATPVTRPPAVIVAIDPSDGEIDQDAAIVEVLPSEKVPVAAICTLHTEPEGHVGGLPVCAVIVGVSGLTAMAVRAGFTQKPAQPATETNKRLARTNHTRIDRPRLRIPTTSDTESYQICIRREEA